MFYVAFLPQFVPDGVSVGPFILLLGAIHALLGMIWFTCLVAATRPVMGLLQRPRVVSACDRLTGGMFVAFGIGLALQSRRRVAGHLENGRDTVSDPALDGVSHEVGVGAEV